MPLVTINEVSLAFGGPPLLDRVSLEVNAGERISLLGRNGEGKTSLMKILSGELAPDSGDVSRDPGARIAHLRQDIPADLSGAVREAVEGAASFPDDWERPARVDRLIQELGLPPEAAAFDLSAGLKRRLILARELVDPPSFLLLDEPTNHLDLKAIVWLEGFLRQFAGAVLFVTHDRAFLQNLATRTLELDRGQLTSWTCDYATYLRRREEQLDAEAKQQAAFDRKLAQEEAWIRRGIKARRTRNEGRVRALQAMREERRARREKQGQVRLQTTGDERSGEKVIVAENISFDFDNVPIVSNFSTRIMRGDRVGILGPNGSGKTTLLRLLLGSREPASGTIVRGSNLQISYFDQLREQLDPEKTVIENVAGDRTEIEINGRTRHVVSYLKDFLFTPDRIRGKARSLSGGERNRLLLARLFTRPSNLLVLDEPTNDLDLETLELLEERLMKYNGTLLLVSHDRAFLNNVVTQLLVFEGHGRVAEYPGGYDDYLRNRPESAAAKAKNARSAPHATNKEPSNTRRPRRFLNRERRELEEIPRCIDVLEEEQEELGTALADPGLYQDESRLASVKKRMKGIQEELDRLYQRWEELETLRESLEG